MRMVHGEILVGWTVSLGVVCCARDVYCWHASTDNLPVPRGFGVTSLRREGVPHCGRPDKEAGLGGGILGEAGAGRGSGGPNAFFGVVLAQLLVALLACLLLHLSTSKLISPHRRAVGGGVSKPAQCSCPDQQGQMEGTLVATHQLTCDVKFGNNSDRR